MKNDKPIECVGCNTFDVGTILDNSDCDAVVEKVFATQQEAEEGLVFLTQKARDTESEPCQISHQYEAVEGGVKLSAKFTFSCQAEVVIFQLNTRAF